MNGICALSNDLHFKVQGLKKPDSYKCHQIDLIFFPFKQSSVGLNPESLNQTYYGLDTFHLTTGMCLLGRRKNGEQSNEGLTIQVLNIPVGNSYYKVFVFYLKLKLYADVYKGYV